MASGVPEPLFDYPAHFFPVDVEHEGLSIKVLKIGWEGVCMDDTCGEPALIYFHGGGYIGGSPRGYANFCARLSRLCSARVYSVDYRLAPEHDIQDGVEDCLGVYRWLVETIGQDPSSICLAGDSAGGGLVLAVLQAICGGTESQFSFAVDNIPKPAGAVLISPFADVSFSSNSAIGNLKTDKIIAKKVMNVIRKYTLKGDINDDNDPRISFLQGMFFESFPPMFICASETETLYDDAISIASKAKARGVEVHLDTVPYGVHIYPIFNLYAPEYQNGLFKIGQFIRSVFHMDRKNLQVHRNRPKFIPGSPRKRREGS
eukprot:CAMPEP_0184017242 /NCGR_PEP_ID=MMETSP0954-20121128/7410_1 /TAXON_ID=627963 /ORGANISM="Aplanochytrium sp, Strain PBS07" /LENGTH=316 /DNA_ID=CAMNT_0026298421 /DNA_START=402 /DNA_END=1349 /DNA_ORIENTATION=+